MYSFKFTIRFFFLIKQGKEKQWEVALVCFGMVCFSLWCFPVSQTTLVLDISLWKVAITFNLSDLK